MSTPSREIHLVKRPEGPPTLDDFAMVETQVADPATARFWCATSTCRSIRPCVRA